ncbi:MAG TPA: HNH endonuclease signature motif containing protein [Candidatus Paceibacterota bacterium]|nr:HNH endonuclease signature motif containing protein [Candidatus Paceibacterota bacterium]
MFIQERRKRKWSLGQLSDAVKNSKSIRQVIDKLGLVPAGGNYEQLKKYIKQEGLNTGHFTGKVWNKGLRGIGKPRVPLFKILTKDSPFQSFKLKKRLFAEGIKSRNCELCGWAKTAMDGRLPLELDHINGNKFDNRIENLRILCPNCHSLQPTHRGRNQKRYKNKPEW